MGREDLIGRRPKARTLQPISACALPADRRHISTDVTGNRERNRQWVPPVDSVSRLSAAPMAVRNDAAARE